MKRLACVISRSACDCRAGGWPSTTAFRQGGLYLGSTLIGLAALGAYPDFPTKVSAQVVSAGDRLGALRGPLQCANAHESLGTTELTDERSRQSFPVGPRLSIPRSWAADQRASQAFIAAPVRLAALPRARRATDSCGLHEAQSSRENQDNQPGQRDRQAHAEDD